jgi:hypothetical protein
MNRVPLLLVLFVSITLLSAAPIEFTAAVGSVEKDGDSVKLYLSLTDSFTSPVWITDQTEIRDKEGEPLGIDDLEVGMVVAVEGRPTELGVVALEIRIVENLNDFELKGEIQSIDSGARLLVLMGFTVHVHEEAEIKGTQGRSLELEDLSPGLWVKVEGTIEGARMIASEIRVRQALMFRANVNFEGIITEIEDSTLKVAQQGGSTAVVRISLATIVKGTLQVGALVRVHGWLAEDLAVEARQITVQPLLMAHPERIRMDVNQQRRVQVLLRTALEVDAVLEIVPETSLVSVPSTLTIPAGVLDGFFLIDSSTDTGSTNIAIRLPANLGGASTAVAVVVGDKLPDPAQKVSQMRFAPSKLQMATSQTRLVRLHVNRPVSSDLAVALNLLQGNSDLLSFPLAVTIPAGSNGVELEIAAGGNAGAAVIRAASVSEGISADLEVEIRAKAPGRSGR